MQTKNGAEENDKSILNESYLQLLKKNCGTGVKKQKRKRIPKVILGKIISFLDHTQITPKSSLKKTKGKATPSSTASCSYSTPVEEESGNEEEIWVCVEG